MVDLPSSNGFMNIMVVVNCLMKMWYIVSIDSIDAILVAECFVRYIFKLHRFFDLIISNYRSQFVLDF